MGIPTLTSLTCRAGRPDDRDRPRTEGPNRACEYVIRARQRVRDRPQIGDLIFQFGHGPVVVKHDVGGGQPLLRGWPGRRSGPRPPRRRRARCGPSSRAQLRLVIDVDHHARHRSRSCCPVSTSSGMTWTTTASSAAPPLQLGCPGAVPPDERSAPSRDGPPDRRRRSCPARRDPAGRRASTSVAEPVHDRGQAGRARLDHLTRQHVGVDHHRAAPASSSATVLLPEAIPPVSPPAARRCQLARSERPRRAGGPPHPSSKGGCTARCEPTECSISCRRSASRAAPAAPRRRPASLPACRGRSRRLTLASELDE